MGEEKEVEGGNKEGGRKKRAREDRRKDWNGIHNS